MQKKNILWIMTDQHRFDGLSCMGGLSGLTPHLDALAADGIVFENCYTPSPVCGPARTALKSGRFPAACGAVKNWVPSHSPDWLPERLQKVGYHTGMAGKLHICPCEENYGFDWKVLSDAPYSVYANDDKHSKYIEWLREKWNGKDPVPLFDKDESSYDNDFYHFCAGSGFRTVEEHETGWTTDQFFRYLEERDKQKPFFFFLSYFGPHHPYLPPAPYDSWIAAEDVQLPQSYYDDLMKDHPVFERTARVLREKVKAELTEEQVKQLVAQYYGQIKMLDDSIGQAIETLKQQGLYEDTTIIFTSDHGDHMAQYGLFFKSQMYDSCCKVPLIIKPAGGCVPFRTKQVVSSLDLYGTILDLAEDKDWRKPDVEAGSLVPLTQENLGQEGEAYSIYGPNHDKALAMLRQGPWKLIRLADGSKTQAVYELYNMEQDPQETEDLYPNQKDTELCKQLQNKLDDWFYAQYDRYPKL